MRCACCSHEFQKEDGWCPLCGMPTGDWRTNLRSQFVQARASLDQLDESQVWTVVVFGAVFSFMWVLVGYLRTHSFIL